MKQIFKLTPLILTVLPLVRVYAQSSADFSYFDSLLGGFLGLINTLIVVVVALALLFFLWGMALLVKNAANEEKRSEGKQKMIWGIIALTVIIGIWGIVKFLQVAFDIEEGVILVPEAPQ